MQSYGVMLARILVNSMTSLPAPLVHARLILALSDALDELPMEKAIRIIAHHVCDVECKGADNPDECYDACVVSRVDELKRLLKGAEGDGQFKSGY